MCTRGEWQLERLLLRYCNSIASSRGARDFIRHDLADFARRNPQVRIDVISKGSRNPCVVGVFKHGDPKQVDLKNKSKDEVLKVFETLRNNKGYKVVKIKKPKFTKMASIQGKWTERCAVGIPISIRELDIPQPNLAANSLAKEPRVSS